MTLHVICSSDSIHPSLNIGINRLRTKNVAVTTHGYHLAYVFNDNYPKIKYSEFEFVQDTGSILNLSGNGIVEIAGRKPSGLQPGFRVFYP